MNLVVRLLSTQRRYLSKKVVSVVNMNYTEHEKLYSPTTYSKRENMVPNHMDFAAKETEKNRKNIPCSLDVAYGEKPTQKYDIYGTDLPNDAPIFVFIHGGYWQDLSKDLSGYVVAPMHKNKIKSFVIGYTMCPAVGVPDVVKDIETAVKSCIEYAKKHGSRGIVMSGYSAGAQLIAILFSTLFPKLTPEERSLFRGVILCCGIYDLTPLVGTYINEPLKMTLEVAKSMSPMLQNFEKMNLRIHVCVGDIESPAFMKQSEEYYNKIKNLTDATFKIMEGEDHASICEKYCDENYELVKLTVDILEKDKQ